MKNKYLQEAIRIGDQLLELMEEDEHGISWQTILRTPDYIDSWHKSYSLYWGVTGIVYFLVSLYSATQNKKYLRASKKGMQWAEWNYTSQKTNSYSLLCGQMSIAFTFLQLYKVTTDKKYLTKALSYTKNCHKALKQDTIYNEYLDGIASTLLSYLHLYAVSKEKFLLASINDFVAELIKNAKLTKKGIYWDVNPRGIRPLTGITHGTSGIGFVFLELGHYFKNQVFYFIAEQAFSYENDFYNPEQKNWPDFRIGIVEEGWEKIKEAYLSGRIYEFTKHRFLSSWCHGAGGIGLIRLRAYELLHSKSYKSDLEHAKDNIELHKHISYTLCHGEGGNADMYLEEYLLSRDRKSLKKAQNVADKALSQKKTRGLYISGIQAEQTKTCEDLTFFNGIAGIGYFMLRVYDPEKFPSFLTPKINQQADPGEEFYEFPALRVTESEIEEKLLVKDFPQTYHRLRELIPHKVKKLFLNNIGAGNLRGTFITNLKTLLLYLPSEQRNEIQGLYTIELTKVKVAEKIKSNALLLVKERISNEQAKKLLSLSEENFLNISLYLDKQIMIININGVSHVFKPGVYKTYHTLISQFCEIILISFKQKKSIQDVLQELYILYDVKHRSDKERIYNEAIKQIKDAIQFSILIQ